MRAIQTQLCFSPMDMLLQLEVMTRPAGCSTSGPTRSSVSTVMTTSSVESLVLHSVNPVVFYLLDMMTSTATFGTHSELNEQVSSRAMITACPVLELQRTEWQSAQAPGTPSSKSGTNVACLCWLSPKCLL